MRRHLVSRKGVHHAIVGVESDDRSFRWVGVAGDASPGGPPMREDTPFHIASIDKLCTASVVLRLHEHGRVRLDEPISAYLSRALIGGIHRLDGVDSTERITVRHLLSHTSGLPDCLEERPRGGKSLMERLFEGGDMAWTIEDLTRIVREDLTPHFPPQRPDAERQRARYSDTNFQLLIAIIEVVTGRPLHEAFEELLFRPLGMRHTWLFGYSQPIEPTPEPATIWVDDRPLNLPLALRSFPSVYSTAGDCLTFLRALLRGDVFDDPATLGLMRQRWNRLGFALDPAALRSPGWPIEYGLGIMRFRLPRVFTLPRAVPAVIGHTGSTGCWLFHCPERYVFLCGTVDQAAGGAVPYRFVPRLLRALG